MGDVVYLRGHAELAQLSVTSPRVFNIVTRTMALQPEIDPSAGYGALQIAMLLLKATPKFTDKQLIGLEQLVSGDALKLYIIVKALSLNVIKRDLVEDHILSLRQFKYPALVRGIRKIDSTFKAIAPARDGRTMRFHK